MATKSDLIELRLIQVDEDDVRAMGVSSLERAIARRGEAHPISPVLQRLRQLDDLRGSIVDDEDHRLHNGP